MDEQLTEKQIERLATLGLGLSSFYHGLNSHLQSIQGVLETIAIHVPSEDKQFIQVAYSELEEIAALSRDVKSLALGEYENLETERKDMRYFVDKLLDGYIRRNIHVSLQPGHTAEVNINQRLFGRAIDNIVNNAYEAVGNDMPIEFRIGTHEDKVYLEISDFGDGVPVEIRDRIFNPLFTFGKEKGSGFGLYDTEIIMKSHGGEVYLKDAEQGATFRIELPKAQT